jgi:hypothetical protein
MGRIRPTAIAIVLVAALAAPLSALAYNRLANRLANPNLVSAKLSYGGAFPDNTNLHLAIALNGRQLYSQPVRSRACGKMCGLVGLGTSHSPLRVLDLESDWQPDVVLGLYSGGAHCCFIDQVYSLEPGTTTYVMSEHDFMDAGAAIEDLDHHEEFVSANNGLAYVFSDFAHSGAPIQIWSFSDRTFSDVTRRYPAQIEADAAKWLGAFKHNLGNGDGFIAAWAADEDLLGNSKLVSSTLATQLHEGHLHSSLGTTDSTGAGFVSTLQKLLHKLGYTH